jgi:hypothetical protein
MKTITRILLIPGGLVLGLGLLSTANAAVSANGLVAYYDFAGNGNDTANNGVLTDNAIDGAVGTLESGFDSTIKAFDTGSLSVTNGDYLILNYPAELQFGTGSFTFAYWMRIPDPISSDPTIIGNKNWSSSGGNLGFVQAISGDDVKSNVADTVGRKDTGLVDLDQASASQGPANTPADGWVFLALVVDRDANLLSNYVADTWVSATTGDWNSGVTGADFGEDSSNPSTVDISGVGSFDTNGLAGYAVNIGQDGDGGDYNQLTANIDDLSVWNRALSREELWEMYYNGRQENSLSGIVVPEPSSVVILFSLSGLCLFRRRRS